MASPPTVVVGAGPAGLAAAAMLRRDGVDALVLERGDRLGTSWRSHYRSLRLHTVRSLSGLPGAPLPRSHGRWVAGSDFLDYLERYADRERLEIRTGTEVRSDIALDLARGGASRVWLSTRAAPGLVPRQALGLRAQVAAIPLAGARGGSRTRSPGSSGGSSSATCPH